MRKSKKKVYKYATSYVVSRYSQLGPLGLKNRKSITKSTFLKNTGLAFSDYNHKYFKGLHDGKACYCRSVKSTKFIYVYIYI